LIKKSPYKWIFSEIFDTGILFTENTPWEEDEPNNQGGEDCAEINTNGELNDNGCTAFRRGLCEKPITPFVTAP